MVLMDVEPNDIGLRACVMQRLIALTTLRCQIGIDVDLRGLHLGDRTKMDLMTRLQQAAAQTWWLPRLRPSMKTMNVVTINTVDLIAWCDFRRIPGGRTRAYEPSARRLVQHP